MTSSTFSAIASVPVDRETGSVYEMGWHSWSPSSEYPVTATSARPATGFFRIHFRPETPAPATGFQGEGLLAVRESADGGVHVFSAADGHEAVPSIRAELEGREMLVTTDGPVESRYYADSSMHSALAGDADAYVARNGTRTLRPVPAIWASWYQYFTEFTQADLDANLDAMNRLDLPVGIVRLDDAFQAGIGDWLEASDGFGSLDGMVGSVLDRGRQAGVWTAPFLVGTRSKLFAEHGDWLVRDRSGAPILAHRNWGQDCYVLDATHPGAREYLRTVFETYKAWGVSYFMIDFVYAGAMAGRRHADVDGVRAYTEGLALIREAIGEDAYLQGCGAPLYPSIGFVDTMRVGADIAPEYAAAGDELGSPGGECAIVSTIGRAFTQGRYWINDPDCLIARPEVERREQWAEVVEEYGGVRIGSDGLCELDEWGLETTRRLLTPARTEPFDTGLPLTTAAVADALRGRDRTDRR